MRRIYKPNNVTTSDNYFLLGDIGQHTFDRECDDELLLGCSEEDENLPVPADQSDDFTEKLQKGENRPTAKRHAAHSIMQDIAQLEQLRDQIIAQATAESTRLIEEGHAKAQAEYQAAIVRASEQIERDRQAARAQGHQQALAQTMQDITSCIDNIEQTLARLESVQASFITGYEQNLKWTALEIAQKILVDTITADDTRLVPLVMAAVNSASSAPWMSVEISEHMTGLLTQLQQKLQDSSISDRVSIRLIDAPLDTCIIETPDKFLDASITQQLENLKSYFAVEQGDAP